MVEFVSYVTLVRVFNDVDIIISYNEIFKFKAASLVKLKENLILIFPRAS